MSAKKKQMQEKKKQVQELAHEMMHHGDDFIRFEENAIKSRRPEYRDKFIFPDVTGNTPLYRYVTAGTFLSMIEHVHVDGKDCVVGENWLSHISRWQDPFEGLVFRRHPETAEVLNDKNGDAPLRDLYRNYFGQSWTLCSTDSDLRWRAYCPNCDGVRIESTVERLHQDFIQRSTHAIPSGCLFGRIFYRSKKEIQSKLNLIEKDKRNRHFGIEMLFIKELAFSDEQEYRVIADGSLLQDALKRRINGLRIENGFLKYELKRDNDSHAFTLFDKIVLDPRMPELDVERLKSRIAQTGLRCTVEQSQIYKW